VSSIKQERDAVERLSCEHSGAGIFLVEDKTELKRDWILDMGGQTKI